MEITADTAQEYRIHRAKTSRTGKPPARNTLDNEVITLRLVMKVALRKGLVTGLPDFSAPYKKQMKVVRRPWFASDEYKTLYTATRNYARAATRDRQKHEAEELHDYVLFMANIWPSYRLASLAGKRGDRLLRLLRQYRRLLRSAFRHSDLARFQRKIRNHRSWRR